MSYADDKPSSPCVKICVVDPTNAICIGCGRTVEEIALWSELSQEERRAAMAKLPERLKKARFRSPRAAQETAGRK